MDFMEYTEREIDFYNIAAERALIEADARAELDAEYGEDEPVLLDQTPNVFDDEDNLPF
jgi:hypothetical protein